MIAWAMCAATGHTAVALWQSDKEGEVCCRLDGLDPMIAWAMCAATGHTAVALW
jgi:hypothetical protein